MEVHHHGHHSGPKNWKSYFWEFMMLFLAVFCGYMAETYHTHSVNKGIERKNMEGYIRNLERDKVGLQRSIRFCEQKMKLADSLSLLPKQMNNAAAQQQFFALAFKLGYTDSYRPDESVFIQMQSSNTLRLIGKNEVVDSLLHYHQRNVVLVEQQANVYRNFHTAMASLTRITDLRDYPNLKLNANQAELNYYINQKILENYETANYLHNFLKPQLAFAERLIPFIKTSYEID